MTSSLLTLALTVVLGQAPLPPGGYYPPAAPYGGAGVAPAPAYGGGYGGYAGGGPAGGGYAGGAGSPYGGQAVYAAGDSTHAFGTGDPNYAYDAPEPWVHGHWQEIPAYGGYAFFRPYNYKHVLSQSQVAGAWGMNPATPYSQEYFRRASEQQMYEQRLSEVRASAYNAELARLRAQHDFERQAQTGPPPAAAPSHLQAPTAPAGSPNMVVRGTVEPRGQYVDPAAYQRMSRIDELNRQIEQQQQQLRQLQDALNEEYQPTRPPAPRYSRP